jgi:predicted ATPase
MMAKTKIKSRDEKLVEAWNEYYKYEKQKNKLYHLIFDYDKYIESKLKEMCEKGIFSKDLLRSEYDSGAFKYKPENMMCEDWEYRLKYINDSDISEDLKQNLCDMINHWLIYYNEIQNIKSKAEIIKTKLDNFNRFNSLCIKNFKGFSDKNSEEENTIKIKPITLIYGPNSYGKSSIMQTLLMLNQTINESNDFENIPLSPKGNMVDLGNFQDFINDKDTSKELQIELKFPPKFYDCNYNYLLDLEEITYCLSFKKEETIKFDKIITYKNSLGSKEKELISSLDIDKDLGQNKRYIRTSFYTIEKNKNYKETFSGRHFQQVESKIESKILDSAQLEKVLKNIVYISSYRTMPERVFVTVDNAGKYVGKTGQYTTDILLYKENKELRKKVNKWLYNIAKYRLSLNNKSVTSVTLNDEETKINNVNLLDLGSGIAHVLPIITQAFVSKENMILIEEPEIHLHPKAQAELASMLAEIIKNTDNTFILETHSENMLLRLRKLIRHGELSKDDVSVIYVDKKEGKGSYCIPLELDEEGYITNINDIPGGFFEEGLNDLFDFNKEQK